MYPGIGNFFVTITLSLDICSSPELGGGISPLICPSDHEVFFYCEAPIIIKSVGSRRSRNPDSRF